MTLKDLSLKMALHNFVLKKTLFKPAIDFLHRALEFFKIQASTFRRASECPSLAYILSFYIPATQSVLTEQLSTVETLTLLLETGQAGKLAMYMEVMNVGVLDFSKNIWATFQQKYNKEEESHISNENKKINGTSRSEDSNEKDQFNIFQSMIEIFQAFGDEGSMNIQRFLFMLDYFDFEERYSSISRHEVLSLFEGIHAKTKPVFASPLQKQRTELNYSDFKTVVAHISAALNVSVLEFIKSSLIRIEMKRLFAEHSYAKNIPQTPAGSSTFRKSRSGSRPIVIDSGGFYRVLQACNVTDKISVADSAVFFKNAATRDSTLLRFNEFYTCMENVASYLELDLLAFVTPFRLTTASGRRVCIFNVHPQIVRNHSWSDSSEDKIVEFCKNGNLLANLYVVIQQDTYALAMLYMILASCYGLESFSELSQALMSVLQFDVLQQILCSFDLIADCSFRLASCLLSERAACLNELKLMKEERSKLDILLQNRRRRRNTRRNAEAKEDSVAVYEINVKHLDQLNAEILDKAQEIDEISREIHELRRRAQTSVQAIHHLLEQDKRLSSTQVTGLCFCLTKLQNSILLPENGQWRIPRLSFFAVTRLLHVARRAKERLRLQAEGLK